MVLDFGGMSSSIVFASKKNARNSVEVEGGGINARSHNT
jgi:hypothetical protein